MGYHVIDPSAVDPTPDRPSVQRSIDEAAGLEHVAVKLYEPDPGEQIPLGYHYHDEQEEVFYVTAGELRVETPDRKYVVGVGEAFVAEPGSPHRAFVSEDADGPVAVLAVGAPRVDDGHAYEP